MNPKHVSLLLLLLVVSCATVRTITYPSPCLDRGDPIRCQVTGYEVWGSPNQIQAQAKECPKSAHVTIDPHRDYGVIRCYEPFEVDEADSIVVVEDDDIDDDEPADLEVTLQEAEAPLRPKEVPVIQPAPEPQVRDQPRVERPTKAKRKRRARQSD